MLQRPSQHLTVAPLLDYADCPLGAVVPIPSSPDCTAGGTQKSFVKYFGQFCHVLATPYLISCAMSRATTEGSDLCLGRSLFPHLCCAVHFFAPWLDATSPDQARSTRDDSAKFIETVAARCQQRQGVCFEATGRELT